MIDVTKNDPNGCHQRALPDEPVFTLLARDPQAPALIRKWAMDREREWEQPVLYVGDLKPVHPDSARLEQARYVAARMEVWRYENEGKWRAEGKSE